MKVTVHKRGWLEVFLGKGVAVKKSLTLTPESVQPLSRRTIAFELLGAGAGVPPSEHEAVVP